MHIYTLVYYMCTQKGHKDYPKELYHLCKQALDDHLDSIVLPSLNEKHGNFLLAEMLQSWEKHKLMVRWLRRFFDYLDRVSITWKSLHSLEHMGWIGFRDMVFNKLKSTLTTTVIGMINDERNGLLIDRALLKNVIHMCNEFGDSELNSYPEYILKAEECLQKEKEQVYSHSTTEPKDTSDKGMALVKHGTDTAKSRKDKKNEVMGFLSKLHLLIARLSLAIPAVILLTHLDIYQPPRNHLQNVLWLLKTRIL
ncbi:cullin-1 isoform X3 [Oryza sativa Japonica Group]|uniref:cullin-1 isoform X3 n=1 Tax=Oryza sativa subsp. japonica TaxID=39947 RepID=UPI000E1BC431|nr:cullin-1 isoform X3 [Oryza sativa Japonica Group]